MLSVKIMINQKGNTWRYILKHAAVWVTVAMEATANLNQLLKYI
jgi:pentose-5-phosphate-3-epimerase